MRRRRRRIGGRGRVRERNRTETGRMGMEGERREIGGECGRGGSGKEKGFPRTGEVTYHGNTHTMVCLIPLHVHVLPNTTEP